MARQLKPTPTITEPIVWRNNAWKYSADWNTDEGIWCEGEIVTSNKKLIWVSGGFNKNGGGFGLCNYWENARGGRQWERDLNFVIENGKVVSFSGLRHFPLELKARMCALGVEF